MQEENLFDMEEDAAFGHILEEISAGIEETKKFIIMSELDNQD